MGDLSELASEYKGSGFRIIGLAADVTPEGASMLSDAKKVFEDAGGSFTNIAASLSVKQAMLRDVSAVPTTKFYDSEGRLITVVHGAKSKQKWIDIIETVMNEKA
ncbi:MAG: hypothetical protein SPL16_05755 [Eubacteriales bacterium]|nr:hypothetical protein [Clostridiales bacterium]MDY5710210.1 hypothetical protein [Eubacteriales bacterium]